MPWLKAACMLILIRLAYSRKHNLSITRLTWNPLSSSVTFNAKSLLSLERLLAQFILFRWLVDACFCVSQFISAPLPWTCLCWCTQAQHWLSVSVFLMHSQQADMVRHRMATELQVFQHSLQVGAEYTRDCLDHYFLSCVGCRWAAKSSPGPGCRSSVGEFWGFTTV